MNVKFTTPSVTSSYKVCNKCGFWYDSVYPHQCTMDTSNTETDKKLDRVILLLEQIQRDIETIRLRS